MPKLIILFQGVRGGPVDHTKSNLDNIVGSLWQARQESSGSSVGNQVDYIFFGPQIFFVVVMLKYFLFFPLNALFCEQAGIIRSTCAIIQTIFHVITIQAIRIPPATSQPADRGATGNKTLHGQDFCHELRTTA